MKTSFSSDDATVANAGSRDQVERAGRAEKRERKKATADWRAVLELPAGQRVLWAIMAHSKMNGTCMDPMGRDAFTNFNAGMQNVGQFVLASILAAHPDAYLQMLLERKDPQ